MLHRNSIAIPNALNIQEKNIGYLASKILYISPHISGLNAHIIGDFNRHYSIDLNRFKIPLEGLFEIEVGILRLSSALMKCRAIKHVAAKKHDENQLTTLGCNRSK